MLAELHGKISSTCSNLTERKEDELTGNFLGSLRYLPFEQGLRPILLQAVRPAELANYFADIMAGYWADNLTFWPHHHEGELDALLTFDTLVIGLEFKLDAPLSSDDTIDNHLPGQNENAPLSCNQLAREARIVQSLCRPGQRGLLLLIADQNVCRDIYADVLKRRILPDEIPLGYLTWQDILSALRSIKLIDPFQDLILQDLIALLTAKGFQRFTGCDLYDLPLTDANRYFSYSAKPRALLRPLAFPATLIIQQGEYYEYR